jgi:NAD(P)-dependent dehydrogenase (short-subunit alcohol dehydrogenase family)
VPCDVREPEHVDAMLDTVLEEFGRIDLLVNNAGGQFVAQYRSGNLGTVHTGHLVIQQSNLRAVFLDRGQRRGTVVGLSDHLYQATSGQRPHQAVTK